MSVIDVSYGDSSSQFVRIHKPTTIISASTDTDNADALIPYATVVIIHGGFFKSKYGIDNAAIDTLAPFLVNKNYVVCEVEYRRSEEGGWPLSNQDIENAIESISNLDYVDSNRIIIIGHSAGGTLALWLCSQGSSLIKSNNEFLEEKVNVALCVAVAPITDLIAGARQKLSDEGDAIQRYMGNGDIGSPLEPKPSIPSTQTNSDIDTNIVQEKDAYTEASPASLLPLRCPTVLVAGSKDEDIPLEMIDAYYRAASSSSNSNSNSNSATASGSISLLVHADADHYDLMNAQSNAWLTTYNTISTLVPA